MEESNFNKKTKQLLEKFDNLEPIEPSDEWQASLNHRLAQMQPSSTSGFSTLQYSVVLLIFIVINSAFIFNILTKNTPPQYSERIGALKKISTELLISSQPNN